MGLMPTSLIRTRSLVQPVTRVCILNMLSSIESIHIHHVYNQVRGWSRRFEVDPLPGNATTGKQVHYFDRCYLVNYIELGHAGQCQRLASVRLGVQPVHTPQASLDTCGQPVRACVCTHTHGIRHRSFSYSKTITAHI